MNQWMEERFAGALRDREFKVWYQPKVNPGNGRTESAEALIRWQLPDGTMISPGDFIPLFERDGNIIQLDEYVLKTVCGEIHERLLAGKRLIPVSINMSRRSLFQEASIQRYREIMTKAGVSFEMISIEVTESIMTDKVVLVKNALAMVDMGFRLDIDDFGTGYSSLPSLLDMPFSRIKIDKSVVDHIGEPRGDLLIQTIMNLAHQLDMAVVAEGAETAVQVESLRKLGCDLVQGFYYSRPLPHPVFADLVDRDLVLPMEKES